MARFKAGQTKPAGSGRRKGVGNVSKTHRVAEVLACNDKDPIAEVLALLPQLEPREQVKVWLELQSYCEAKPKAADPAAKDGPPPEDPTSDVSTAALLAIARGKA